jgi:hypothetical protein
MYSQFVHSLFGESRRPSLSKKWFLFQLGSSRSGSRAVLLCTQCRNPFPQSNLNSLIQFCRVILKLKPYFNLAFYVLTDSE